MNDIKRFLNTKDARMLKIYQVLLWVLCAFIFIFNIIMSVRFHNIDEIVTLSPISIPIILFLIINPLLNFLAAFLATIFSGIGSRTAFLQSGIIAYINDGVKRKIRLNPNTVCFILPHVVTHKLNIHDDASFQAERRVLVRFHLWLIIIYPIMAVLFTALNIFFYKGIVGLTLELLSFATCIWAPVLVSLGSKSENNAKNYLRAKFDDLYIIANLTDTLTFATNFNFDPEPVRAYKINGICKELANPAVDPDAKLTIVTVENVFVDYIMQGRTDFPKIISDYLEYYIANCDRLFAGKNCTLNCGLWQCTLYYLALTGRREAAVNDYNNRATFMIVPGKPSQFINGSLRYQLFNEDYSVWLLDRKNMYPSPTVYFIDKWFEIPYFNEAEYIIKLHTLIWGN
jgi:hypothetical protein